MMVCLPTIHFYFYSKSLDLPACLHSYRQCLSTSLPSAQEHYKRPAPPCEGFPQGQPRTRTSLCPASSKLLLLFLLFWAQNSCLVSERRKTSSASLRQASSPFKTRFLLRTGGIVGERKSVCTNDGENKEGIFISLSGHTHSRFSFSLTIKDAKMGVFSPCLKDL